MVPHLVFVYRQVIVGLTNILRGHHERLLRPVGITLPIAIAPSCETSGQIIRFDGIALVVQRVAIRFDVKEEYVVSAPTLGENKDAGRDAGIGLEHSARQRNDCLKLVLIQQQFAQGDVGGRGTEKHAVRHNRRRPSALVQHAQDQHEEEQLRLLRFHLAQKRGVDILEIETSLEWWVGQDDVKTFGCGLRELVGEAGAQCVLIVDVRIIDAVQHQVHGGDAQHSGVEVEPMEHAAADVVAVRFQQIAGVGLFRLARLGIGFFQHPLGRGVIFQQILHRLDKEAAGAAGRIADHVGGLWFQHIDHQPDDVARRAELTEAPVIVLGHLTEAQRRAYRIADNKLTELGSWDEALLSAELNELLAEDFDLSLVGFSDGELDKLLAYVPEEDGNEGGAGGTVPPVVIPEPPRNPASRTGDLWILGDHRLLCGDSTSHDDVRRLMNGERAILFATDPPYLVDYDGSNHPTRNKDWSQSYGVTWDDSSQGAELYDGFIAAAVAEAITEDAAWYCWHASRRQAMLEACWEKAGAFVHQQIIWVKDRGVLTRSHYLWKHEPCFMGWRRPNRPPKVAEQTLPSTWEMPSFAKDERPDHPTPKPLDAFGIPMRQHVARGGLCYEPFCGSGSQIMAGEANGRRVFAMEISPAYVDVAVERWQAETGKDAILDGDGRTFAQVRTERLGDDAEAPADTPRSPDSLASPRHNEPRSANRLLRSDNQ